MPFSVATRWPFASRAVATSNERPPSLVRSGRYCFTANGSSVNVHSFTAPRTPCGAPILAMQTGAPKNLRRPAGGFGVGLALRGRHGLVRVLAGLALLDAGGVEETRDTIARLPRLNDRGF